VQVWKHPANEFFVCPASFGRPKVKMTVLFFYVDFFMAGERISTYLLKVVPLFLRESNFHNCHCFLQSYDGSSSQKKLIFSSSYLVDKKR